MTTPSQEASQGERLKIPGFGLPVDHEPLDKFSSYFYHALWDEKRFRSVGIYMREMRMMDFINQVTDKPNWEEKVFDDTIIARWKDEANSLQLEDFDLDGDVYFSDKMFENCVKELREKAERVKETGIVNVFDAELVVAKSDTIVPQSLVDVLKTGVKALEDVPDNQKDWHPGSNGRVLDLLHPSLYPLVHGISRVLPYGKVPLQDCISFIGKGEATVPFTPKEYQPENTTGPAVWGSNQWLPSDLEWTDTGLKVASYINNLHPWYHGDLYNILAQFATLAVPLWEECLFSWELDTLMPRINTSTSGKDDFHLPEGVVYKIPDEYILEVEEGEDIDEDDLIDQDYLYSEEYRDWFDEHKIMDWPEPDDYFSRKRGPEREVNLRERFPSGLQVIFKLANIHLTPENPYYDGGSWHIEGALNDRIVATALYYYDTENITESRLAFKQGVAAFERVMEPPQYEWESLARWLGVEQSSDAFQEIGSVLTRPGRLLAFPNVFQHQVQPFKLEDETKPGHRKILAMFLVDPNIRVLSTGVVPPQRKDWWEPEVRKIPPFCNIPVEIFALIMDFIGDFPIGWEQAVTIREKLMQERSRATNEWETKINNDSFNFCEH